ncbi:RNA polymerase sigma factor [uncultured Phycicoccus sp.]|uniref:RNA polymerase sigma factor n=1 Tax=uncultured Phycicoccus sp. TaxID=661422 RepID=UPI0026047477|nr:sigma-70 family RNA polymerase sigma factor [uncultured Phycicoccus sp.]
MRAEDRPDYEWVFSASFSSITRTVFLIVHDREAAEEITQEAFVKLLQYWDAVAGYDHPQAWVRKVATRMAVRHAARERRRPTLEARAHRPTAVVPSDPALDVIEAVRDLAPMQRAAVVLHYFEDRPVGEIAGALQVSESTVKQHLYRARAHLARTLGEAVTDDVR